MFILIGQHGDILAQIRPCSPCQFSSKNKTLCAHRCWSRVGSTGHIIGLAARQEPCSCGMSTCCTPAQWTGQLRLGVFLVWDSCTQTSSDALITDRLDMSRIVTLSSTLTQLRIRCPTCGAKTNGARRVREISVTRILIHLPMNAHACSEQRAVA